MWHMRAKWAVLEPGLVQMGQTNRTTGRTGQLIVFATEISLAAHTGCGDLMKKENTSSNGKLFDKRWSISLANGIFILAK